jgi:IS5 family transposase
LQSLYKFSDDQTELQIKCRLSFMHFLGRDFEDRAPDAKTLWLFRDTLSNKNIIDKLFLKFDRDLDHEDLFARKRVTLRCQHFPGS